MTIARGWFVVSEEKLRQLGREQAKRFVWEMLNRGGRIGHDEYQRWVVWIQRNL